MLKRGGEIEAREGRRKNAERLRQMEQTRDIGKELTSEIGEEDIPLEMGQAPSDVQFDEGVAEQELLKEEGVLPESITPDLLMAGLGEGEGDISERERLAANAKVLPKSLTSEVLMAEDDSETPVSAISVLRKMQVEEELPVEKQDKPNGIRRVDTSDLISDMDMSVDDEKLGNEGQYSDSIIAEEEERGGGFRKPTYRSTHHERTKDLPPSKLAEKMQANKERRQMKRLMRKTMEGRRNAK
jgi:hypothetical protein